MSGQVRRDTTRAHVLLSHASTNSPQVASRKDSSVTKSTTASRRRSSRPRCIIGALNSEEGSKSIKDLDQAHEANLSPMVLPWDNISLLAQPSRASVHPDEWSRSSLERECLRPLTSGRSHSTPSARSATIGQNVEGETYVRGALTGRLLSLAPTRRPSMAGSPPLVRQPMSPLQCERRFAPTYVPACVSPRGAGAPLTLPARIIGERAARLREAMDDDPHLRDLRKAEQPLLSTWGEASTNPRRRPSDAQSDATLLAEIAAAESKGDVSPRFRGSGSFRSQSSAMQQSSTDSSAVLTSVSAFHRLSLCSSAVPSSSRGEQMVEVSAAAPLCSRFSEYECGSNASGPASSVAAASLPSIMHTAGRPPRGAGPASPMAQPVVDDTRPSARRLRRSRSFS